MARKQGFKKLETGIFIIGEGQTEYYYFYHLKNIKSFKYTVKSSNCCNNSIKKVNEKIIELLKGKITVICIFDADVSKRNDKENTQLDALKNKYNNNSNVILCESMPSIEYWFLLHYKDTCPHWTKSEQAEKELKKHIINYNKNEDFLKNIKWVSEMTFHKDGGLEEAKKRAKRHTDTNNSYTQVYRAIEKFEEIRNK